jgi:hypothetical protein
VDAMVHLLSALDSFLFGLGLFMIIHVQIIQYAAHWKV